MLGDLKQKTEEEKEEIKNKGLRTIKEKKAVLDNKEEQISQLSRPINGKRLDLSKLKQILFRSKITRRIQAATTCRRKGGTR